MHQLEKLYGDQRRRRSWNISRNIPELSLKD